MGLVRNFLVATLLFALNHGTLTAVLQLSSSSLGVRLGGVSSALLFGFYTISSMLLAAPVVHRLGSVWGLAGGCLGTCCYTFVFLACRLFPHARWPLAIVGSTLGGLSSGVMWASWGSFFADTTRAHADLQLRRQQLADSTDNDDDSATAETDALVPNAGDGERERRAKAGAQSSASLGAVFAAIFLTFEMLLNIVSSLISHHYSQTVLFAVLSSVGFVFALLIPLVRSVSSLAPALDEPARKEYCTDEEQAAGLLAAQVKVQAGKPPQPPAGRPADRILGALRLLLRDRRMACLTPQNMAFGMGTALVTLHVNRVVKTALGGSNVGYMAAITVAVAAVFSALTPLSRFLFRTKLPVMLVGSSAFAAIAVVAAVMSKQDLVKLHWALCFIYVLRGLGRGVYESANKAVVADFFGDGDRPSAFANVGLQAGLSSTIAYSVFPFLSQRAMGIVTAAIATAGIVCLCFAFRLDAAARRSPTAAAAGGVEAGAASPGQAQPGTRLLQLNPDE